MKTSEAFLAKKLEERSVAGNLRSLRTGNNLIDFCSNDYLGFASSADLKKAIDDEITEINSVSNGSTGSRLLTGNSLYAEELENNLATLYYCEAGLIFSSGYTANLALFSALPQKGDTIIVDELIHTSIKDGARLSFANCIKFKHNDLESLESKLKKATGICYVVVESVYSMDGDIPDLKQIIQITNKYSANLIVDEAHAVGLFNLGLVTKQMAGEVFARIVTFGKALGCHGAIVLGSKNLIKFLINFSRPFIYTTAPPLHLFASIKMAFQKLLNSKNEIECLKNNICLFRLKIVPDKQINLIPGDSAIQSLIFKSNERTKDCSMLLGKSGFDVRPILSPTVPCGSERLRICLHSFNTTNEISLLTDILNKYFNAQ